MSKLVGVLAVLCAALAVASASRVYVEYEQPQPLPAGWERVGFAAPSHQLTLTLAMKNRNLDRLEALFWERTNPQSDVWRHWLTLDEVAELTAPADTVLAATRAWLLANGMTEVELTRSRDFFRVRTTVERAESLLQVRFSQFRERATGRVHVCTLSPYSAPAVLAAHIDFVAGIAGFPEPQRTVVRSSLDDVENPNIVPADLLKSYNCSYTASASNNSMSVAEFQAQFYSATDLGDFFERYVPAAKPGDASKVKVVGSNFPNSPGTEASLDIEYIMGCAPGVETWFWSNPAFNFWSDLTAWLSQIANTPDAPWVHSVSYGDQSYTGQPSNDYKDRINTEFQKAGVRGLSIIFASGDSGAGCHLCANLSPSFPATSPYVTSVGATRFLDGVGSEEGAVEAFGSGGGFSYTFDTPEYQKAAVQQYLSTANNLPPSTDFNSAGRATPDVSALGIGYTVISGGRTFSVGGTSASTPTFSALITLLNDKLFNANKPSLGFLNQWIYQTDAADSAAFTDITVGNNKHLCCAGFQTAVGYDPVTGVGTPDFGVLSQHIGL